LAVADPLRIFARPIGTFSLDESLVRLLALHDEEGIDVVVIGWPLLPSGDEGKATEWVQQFINRLKKALPGVELVKWDERYSSERAKTAILAAGVKRKGRRKKGRVDAVAASIILQEYIDESGR